MKRIEHLFQSNLENPQILPVSKVYEKKAKELILEGFLERFGFIDYNLNPDLNAICNQYSTSDRLFLVGVLEEEVLVTGGLIREASLTWRVVRMSVKQSCRRRGLAERMLKRIEAEAASYDCSTLVLETNKDWESAIHFYQKMGFSIERHDEERIHFYKDLKRGEVTLITSDRLV